MLKYENIAQVGERIRSYDFERHKDCYVEGRVQRLDREGKEAGFAAFVIVVDRDVYHDKVMMGPKSRVRRIVLVPMECAYFEYEGRIENLGKGV